MPSELVTRVVGAGCAPAGPNDLLRRLKTTDCFRVGIGESNSGHLPAPSFKLEAARLLIRSRVNRARHVNFMNNTLLKRASILIPNEQLLVNLVRLRVRQLVRGHRPLVEVPPGMGFCDVALSEVIAKKLTYEAVPGIKPDNSFAPILPFPGPPPAKKAA